MSILDIDEKFEGITHEYLISKGFREDAWGSMYDRISDPEGSRMYSLMLYIIDKYNFTKYFGEVLYFPPMFKRYVNFDNKIAYDKAANHVVVNIRNQSKIHNDYFIYGVKDTLDIDVIIGSLNQYMTTEDKRNKSRIMFQIAEDL